MRLQTGLVPRARGPWPVHGARGEDPTEPPAVTVGCRAPRGPLCCDLFDGLYSRVLWLIA
jgi:hypothetical protein